MRLFDMMTDEDLKRIKEDRGPLDLTLKIEQLELQNKKLKDRVRSAEGETSIVKGIGMNSPEMRGAQAKIKELAAKCSEAGRAMIELNLKYETNVRELDRLSEENQNLKTMLKRSNDRHNHS